MDQLDTRKRIMFVHLGDHEFMNRQIAVVPQSHERRWREVTGGVNGTLFGADDAPTPFSLDAAHLRHGSRPPVSHAIAVGNLIKPVSRGFGADRHRLEEDLVVFFHHVLSIATANRSPYCCFKHTRCMHPEQISNSPFIANGCSAEF